MQQAYLHVKAYRFRWFAMGLLLMSVVMVLVIVPTTSMYAAHAKLFEPAPTSQLLMVQGVFRHGARTPLNDMYWPESRYEHCNDSYGGVDITLRDEHGAPDSPPILDPNNPVLAGGCRQGQLTSVGYQMALDFGAWLRERYVDEYELLPVQLQSEALSLRTTCIRRAQQTLQGVVTGLYPAPAEQQQQLTVTADASQEEYEFMYGKNSTCARLGPIFTHLAESLAERSAGDEKLQRLAAHVHKKLQLPEQLGIMWNRLRDTVAAMEAEGLPLPPGANDEVVQIIEEQGVAHEFPINAPQPSDGFLPRPACDEVLRLSLGPLAYRLLTNMRTAAAAAAVKAANAAAARGAMAAAAAAAGSSISSDDPSAAADTGAVDAQHADGDAGAAAAARSSSSSPSHSAAVVLEGAAGVRERDAQSEPPVDASRRLLSRRDVVGLGVASATTAMPRPRSGTLEVAEDEEGGAGADRLSPRRRMYLYSGHDSTVTPLLAMLGTPAQEWPPFLANLLFELWQQGGSSSNSFAVRVLYNMKPLVMPGADADGVLPLEAFERLLATYSVSDHEHQHICKL